MSIEIISQKLDKTINTHTLHDGQKQVSSAQNFILECNGKEEAGTVSIRVPHHHIVINLAERTVSIKDLGTEIRAIK